jgi:hypothetical protein
MKIVVILSEVIERGNVSKMKKLLVGLLALSFLVIPAVSCSQSSPTVPSEVKSEDEARGAAISYIQANYEETAPSPGGDWEGKDITPEGLLGRRTVEFTLDDWKVLVSRPVVAPENIRYEVAIRNTETNWYWRGIVEPDGYVSELVPFQQITQDKSRQIAEEFVKNSPTFTFDGIEESLVLKNTAAFSSKTISPDNDHASYQKLGWVFTFEFDSRHAAYGDRTGQMLAQVITCHVAEIAVEELEITSAVIDNRWDMIQQAEITATYTESEARQMAEEFVRNSPTFQFDGIEESITLVETLYPDTENAWQFVFQFESANAGLGDRTGQMVAEVITPHEAIITVEQGEIKNAVMDGKWDMIHQEMLGDIEISLAPIHEVGVLFMESFPVQVGVHIKGGLRDGCTTFHDAVVTREGNSVNIEITVQRPKDAICTQVYSFFEENLNLGSDFTSGTTYNLIVNDYTTTFVYP